MALRLSTGLVTQLAGTGGIRALMNNGFIGLFTGAQPLTADAAETGSLLALISSTSGTPGVTLGTAASGILPKSAVGWSGTCGTAGVVGWFRFYDVNRFTGIDTPGTSRRFDGDIGVASGILRLTNTTLAVGAPVVIDAATFTIPLNQ